MFNIVQKKVYFWCESVYDVALSHWYTQNKRGKPQEFPICDKDAAFLSYDDINLFHTTLYSELKPIEAIGWAPWYKSFVNASNICCVDRSGPRGPETDQMPLGRSYFDRG